MVVVDGLVAVDGDEVFPGVSGQLAVEVGGGDDGLFVLGEAAGGILHDGEHLGHHLVESFLVDLEHLFLQLVHFGEDVCALVERCLFDGGLQLLYLSFLLVGSGLHLLANLLGACPEGVVVQLLHLGRLGFHLLHERLDKLHVARRLVAEERF